MTEKPKMAEMGRIAFREEGDLWNAYFATTGSMQGAILLGSIRRSTVDHPDRKAAFMTLMRDVLGDVIEETTGTRPSWKEPRPAPEHERTKE